MYGCLVMLAMYYALHTCLQEQVEVGNTNQLVQKDAYVQLMAMLPVRMGCRWMFLS